MKQDIEDYADLISNSQSQRRQWMRPYQSNAILLIGWLLLAPPLASTGSYNIFGPLSNGPATVLSIPSRNVRKN
jgi:hypothetical protein